MVVHSGGSLPDDPYPMIADVSWRMPVDDYSTRTLTIKFTPLKEGRPWQEKREERPKVPPLMRGTRKQFDMATINGQDSAAQVGQGAIADRAQEHLGYSDRGVIQVRKLWKSAIEAVLRGEDPPGIVRGEDHKPMIHIDVIEKLVEKGEMLEHAPRIIRI
jgi:5,5'-dehydrodivanillate O-demethylase